MNLVGSEKGSKLKVEVILYVDTLLFPTLTTAQVMVLCNEQKNIAGLDLSKTTV